MNHEFLNRHFGLSGQTVVVTGAGSGLGRQASLAMVQAGAKVVLMGRRMEPLEATARMIADVGGASRAVSIDVTDSAQFEECLSSLSSEFGVASVLVNNAGVGGRAPLLDATSEQFDRIFGVNVKAAMLVASAFARHLIAHKVPGRVINICSLAAQTHSYGLGVYGASKAALEHLTRTMATEWAGHGINVNAINPGYIETDINRAMFQTARGKAMIDALPRKRLGTPDVLDGALLLLAGPAGAFINASTLTVDDGQRFGVH